MEPIENYLFCDYHEPTIMTRNIKFTSIPPDFEIVIKKMNPEITGIRMIRTEATKMLNPINFEAIDKFLVVIALQFGGGKSHVKGHPEYYSDEINKLFTYTYSDYDFVRFHVHEFDLPPEKTNYDKFVELFGGE
jgi:hypothetical protein